MVYVISDLHGYPHGKFLQLLASAGFGEDDFLYILGDVVDRNGDGGVETLCWLLEQPNAQLILGNHEAMLLSCEFVFQEITDDSIARFDVEHIGLLQNYYLNGGGVTLAALRKLPEDLRTDVFDYLRDAPLYEAVTAGGQDYVLVHAGFGNFDPAKKLSEYDPDDLLWTVPKLTDTYYKDFITVLGHTSTLSFGKEYRGRIIRTDTWVDIDVGAAYGEAPVLLRLDDGKCFSAADLHES